MLNVEYGLPPHGIAKVPVELKSLVIKRGFRIAHAMRVDDQPYVGYRDIFPPPTKSPPIGCWVLIESDEDPGFHPYFDLDHAVNPDEAYTGRALLRTARAIINNELLIAASRMLQCDILDLESSVVVADASRMKPDGNWKISYHIVFRIRYQGVELLWPKWLLKHLVVSKINEKLHPPCVDKAVYNDGVQAFKAVGCAKEEDATSRMEPFYIERDAKPIEMLLLCLPRRVRRYVARQFFWSLIWYSFPRTTPGANTIHFERQRWIDTLELTTLERTQINLQRNTNHVREMMIDAVANYVSHVLETRVSLAPCRSVLRYHPDQVLAVGHKLGVPDDEIEALTPEICFRVVDVDALSMKTLLQLLPPNIVGPRGDGTYPIFFALFMAAIDANCKDEWFQWCSRVNRQPDVSPHVLERTWQYQMNRQRERRSVGARCSGLPRALHVISEHLDEERFDQICRAIDHAHEPPELRDDICRCLQGDETSYIVHCILQPSQTYYIILVCIHCGIRRTIGQIGKGENMKYHEEEHVNVENINTEAARALRLLTESTWTPSVSRWVTNRVKMMVISGCGTGKTELAMRIVNRSCGEKNLFIIPLISVALIDYWRDRLLLELPEGKVVLVNHHLSNTESLRTWVNGDTTPLVIITTLESFHRVERACREKDIYKDKDITVIVDEASKVIMHFNSSTMIARLQQSLYGFVNVLGKAKKLLFMDADMTLTSLGVIEGLFPQFHTRTLINTAPKRTRGRLVTWIASEQLFLNELQYTVDHPADKPRVIFLFSVEKRRLWEMKEAFDQRNIHVPFIVLDADNRPAQDFQSTWQQPFETQPIRTLVYAISPVICSGVSIVVPPEYDVLVFLHVRKPLYLQAIQQSQRVRNNCPVVLHCPSAGRELGIDCASTNVKSIYADDILHELHKRCRPHTIEDKYLPLFVEHIVNNNWADTYPLKWIMYGLCLREGMQWVDAVPEELEERYRGMRDFDIESITDAEMREKREQRKRYDTLNIPMQDERDVEAYGNMETVIAALWCVDLRELVQAVQGNTQEFSWFKMVREEYGDGTDYGYHSLFHVVLLLRKVLSVYHINNPIYVNHNLTIPMDANEDLTNLATDLNVVMASLDTCRTVPHLRSVFKDIVQRVKAWRLDSTHKDHVKLLRRIFKMIGVTLSKRDDTIIPAFGRLYALRELFSRCPYFDIEPTFLPDAPDEILTTAFVKVWSRLPSNIVNRIAKNGLMDPDVLERLYLL